MIEFFLDWSFKAKFYSTQEVKDSTGGISTSDYAINGGADVSVIAYVASSVQTDTADQFKLQEVGYIILPVINYSIIIDSVTTKVTPDTTWKMVYGNQTYYIEGCDNIGFQGEDYKLAYRKERV